MNRSAKSAAVRRRKPTIDTASMQRHADEAVAILKAMGSPNRLMLLCELLEGERSVNDLATSLDLAQSAVSQHLSLLRRDGLVAGRREGQSIYYVISDERVHALMAKLFDLFCAND
ncbi:ArsR/SmtB family transcription factor [Dyella jiangningensis]|nr:metalloregulator ArsR/SmtB family transcription factor [Dyella jiangningensis]